MIRRVTIAVYLTTLVASWLLASQTWASAKIIESQEVVSITASEAYPQLTLIFLAWSLVFWMTRYLNSAFSKFLVSAVVILLFATASPVWFESASGSLNILAPQIAKKTGVSDAGSALIIESHYNHLAADGFVIALILCLVSAMMLIWLPRPGVKGREFVTRIDKLPSW